MRTPATVVLLAALTMAGCASSSEPAASPTAATPPTDQQKQETLDAIRMAMDHGYTIQNQNGQSMYCKEDAKTGTRIKSTMTCLTADQLKLMHDRFQDDLEQMRRKGVSPNGG